MIAPSRNLPDGCVLYVPGEAQLGGLEEALRAAHVDVRDVKQLLIQADSAEGAAVLCADRELASQAAELSALPAHITVVAIDAEAEEVLGDVAELSIASLTKMADQRRVIHAGFQMSACRRAAVAAEAELARNRVEFAELNRLGMALMMEHDHDALLRQIITQAMRLTSSEGGALYVMEKSPAEVPQLRFKIIVSESHPEITSLGHVAIAVDSTSLVGHVALTRGPLVIADVHHLPLGVPYRVNKFVEEEFGYWIKSMLTMPMIDHEGEVVGVMQLGNRKRHPAAVLKTRDDVEQNVISYSERDVQVGLSVACQAAVSIENAQLYEEIEHLLECFVRAAVTAIDQRDPTTSGHSVRVAALVTDLAKALEKSGRGSYRGLRFTPAQMRELRYAALLHDFGKVGVREEVLIKARKLPPAMWARVEMRFDLIRCTMHLNHEHSRAAARAANRDARELTALEEEFTKKLAELERFWIAIRAANEPTVLPHDTASMLDEIAAQQFVRADGRVDPYLTKEELHFLRIAQGSLDETERLEVESHAVQTFEFLTQIPWRDEMKNIASHASSHHEKLNGSGYPHHLTAEDIPLPARLIAIADVFDALTSADRPYKPAVSAEAALAILRREADEGLLDREIVEVLVESQIYRHILEGDWRGL